MKKRIKKLVPHCPIIVQCQYGNVPPSMIFDLKDSQHDSNHTAECHDHPEGCSHHDHDHHHHGEHHHHHKEIESLDTFSYSKEEVYLDLSRFQEFMVTSFPANILRAKGFLLFSCDPNHYYVLQLSGKFLQVLQCHFILIL